jgi:hypothetical protein
MTIIFFITNVIACVLLFELNAWKDEWLVVIKILQEEKPKEKKVTTKGKKKKK